VPLLGVRDTLAQVTLVASVSLALAAFVASALAYAGAWSPLATMLVLLAISAAGLVGQRTLAIRTRRTLAR
jgi:CHASE2 domain-containing sensor protein